MRTIKLKVAEVPSNCQYGVFGVKSNGKLCGDWDYAIYLAAAGDGPTMNAVKQSMRTVGYNNLHEVRIAAGDDDECYIPTADISRIAIGELTNATVWDREMISCAHKVVAANVVGEPAVSPAKQLQLQLHKAVCTVMERYASSLQ